MAISPRLVGSPTDLHPRHPDVMTVDLTVALPFRSSSVEYLHAEHVIEHLKFDDARNLLLECWRVLQPCGVLRIATPDADVFLRLGPDIAAGGERAEQCTHFVRSANERWQVPEPYRDEWLFAVNRVFNWWGHSFIYTRALLDRLLGEAGFERQWQHVGVSNYPILRGIEQHGRHGGDAANKFQTIVVDAVKPAGAETAG